MGNVKYIGRIVKKQGTNLTYAFEPIAKVNEDGSLETAAFEEFLSAADAAGMVSSENPPPIPEKIKGVALSYAWLKPEQKEAMEERYAAEKLYVLTVCSDDSKKSLISYVTNWGGESGQPGYTIYWSIGFEATEFRQGGKDALEKNSYDTISQAWQWIHASERCGRRRAACF